MNSLKHTQALKHFKKTEPGDRIGPIALFGRLIGDVVLRKILETSVNVGGTIKIKT